MKQADLDRWLEERAAEAAQSQGCVLLEVSVRRRGSRSQLQITIDRQGGVTVGHCADVSHRLGQLLEESGTLTEPYLLEVSSPGLDRRLTRPFEYQHFRGRPVRISTRQPIEGRSLFRGPLEGLAESNAVRVRDEVSDRSVEIPWSDIDSARLDELPRGATPKGQGKK